jgi:hypothetical protein
MGWDLEVILWPTVCLLWAVAVIFIAMAVVRRNQKGHPGLWKEYLLIAAFSLAGSLLMLLIKYTGFELSYTARIGIVSVILGIYAYYIYRRSQKSGK